MEFYEVGTELTFKDLDNYIYPNRKVGVIVHIEDENGKILLQQRAQKSRDENGLYEDVGGKLEKDDSSFKEAIIREMKEEMGDKADVILTEPKGIYHVCKKDINWVFIIFFGRYNGGEIKVMEPDKCLGYKFFEFSETQNSELVTESCKYLIKSLKERIK